ncbi:MAG TPA: homocysteine S-methyltransferase family protein [Anaeromyxobacter sp.]
MLDHPTLLDGAMGTALIGRGLPQGGLPEEWLLTRPEEVAAVHAEHAEAGASVLLTCTFNCAAPRLEARLGGSPVEELCGRAARLARSAAPPGVLVAGAVGPTGLHGKGAAPREEILVRYRRALAALAEAGVDLLWIESQWDLPEALAALEAARAVGLPTAVTFGFPEAGGSFRAPDGTPAEACLLAVEASGASGAGVNCVAPGPALTALASWAAGRQRVPFVAKPSPGLPGAVLDPDAFAGALSPAFAAGLRIAGGCCGATGRHLRALGPLVARAG